MYCSKHLMAIKLKREKILITCFETPLAFFLTFPFPLQHQKINFCEGGQTLYLLTLSYLTGICISLFRDLICTFLDLYFDQYHASRLMHDRHVLHINDFLYKL